jgi:mRNA-degrading endonuclease RelE of RelBE toxin-antitoxin system
VTKARERGDSGLLCELRRRIFKLSPAVRARVGDYRIIYTFNSEQNRIHLLALGHRREIYRGL